MTHQPDPILDAILDCLAAKLIDADASRDLAQHINQERIARDGLLRAFM